LPNSSLLVSRLGLGLASVHRINSARGRLELVQVAIDLGITHFDTARLYGDGLAERVLGSALVGRRDTVTITTKFGLYGHDYVGRLGTLGVPIRAARLGAAKLGRRRWPVQDYSVSRLRASIDQSRRLLRTDHVDCLAVHEPANSTESELTHLIAALHELRDRGAIRGAGVAGNGAQELAARWPTAFDVVQAPEREWSEDQVPVPDFTYSALSRSDVAGSLRTALERRPSGSVLVSTRRVDHLRALAEVAEH
jgi:aryl-alcohol dehydrogenase-like predicted oxidoreductase